MHYTSIFKKFGCLTLGMIYW